MNLNIRTFAFRSEFPAITKERFLVIVRHIGLRGDITGDIFPESTITIERP